jgi:hypothetical protein
MSHNMVSPESQAGEAKRLVYSLLRKILKRNFYSQATQDVFALEMLNNKSNGFYLEIGGGHPFDSNNTYLLEEKYGWNGLSLEFSNTLVEEYNTRRANKSTLADATEFDYEKCLISLGIKDRIDYLSIDIDPAENTFKALQKIPHHGYRFSVITYEHDRYQSGDKFMNESRSFLESLGYQLVVKNLNAFGKDFEDWWVDPLVIPPDVWRSFQRNNIEFSELWI